MISFANIMRKVLTERMSFRDLYRVSDPARVDRSKNVRARSLKVASMDGNEAWTFSYKSTPSTTGHRWHGYIRFLKDDVSEKEKVADLECMVDCDCPDYRYRWAYNNAKQDAGALGGNAWNDNNGRPPRPVSQGGVGDLGPGMCKHLIALGEFLKTNVEPNAPEPDEPEQEPKAVQKTKVVQKPTFNSKQTVKAPDPDEDSYTDSRDDGYSDSRSGLSENSGQLAAKFTALVRSKPEFDVEYYDEADGEKLNEDYHFHHNDYRMYEGTREIFAVFEDNSRLTFEVHFRNAHGEDREGWRKKAMTTWKSLANELHRDVQLSDACNPIQKSWKECFEAALSHPKMKGYIRAHPHHKIFDDKGYPSSVQGKVQPCIDPVNFTRKG